MKFNERFPEHARAPSTIGPHPEVPVAEKVFQSWRVYPCGACGAPTGWRLDLASDFPATPCCSEECQAQLQTDYDALSKPLEPEPEKISTDPA